MIVLGSDIISALKSSTEHSCVFFKCFIIHHSGAGMETVLSHFFEGSFVWRNYMGS